MMVDLVHALIFSSLVCLTISTNNLEASIQSCSDLSAVENSGEGSQHRALLCQIAQSTQLLAHLGILVNEGIERILQDNGLTAATEDAEANVEKRKHEYLRFGKRKHEYLRFGKRKHEYLRFGRK